MRKYIMDEAKSRYNKQVQNVYNYRIRKYAVQALKDLALLAEKLPEKRQAEIFNKENLEPLLEALFKLDIRKVGADRESIRRKRERLLPVCLKTIGLLNDVTLAHWLAPTFWSAYVNEQGSDHFAALKALYYRCLGEPETE